MTGDEQAAKSPALFSGVAPSTRSRFVRSLPKPQEVLIGAPGWALAMAISAWLALWLRGNEAAFHVRDVLLLYAFGGLLAWPFSLFAARFAAHERTAETRFSAFLLCLIAGTVGTTACLFAFDYRIFYAQWHAATGTRTWLFQFLFTSLAALYQFLVLGVRLYLPFGLTALVAASLWLARSETR
ncbi:MULTISPECIES: hypothetical protein [unclassified Sinorhizobium]|uniref:hypothetical protein n=1 Tax=unclassified Sinorhizobium TaxID=2613772 RepID=UPI0024C27056|nr:MULTISPECIES: hypothetical protein [unclassified Sinorhizobium]MDK1373035.1 hypothetical protein [Sinorhizobium sp. 6-70]MDK1481527.1 hypothetical protein [Sinorhizobium sp. 6-117]